MILYLGVLLLQITCIVHVIRTGRNQLWILALFFLPVASAIAYLVLEVLPGHRTNRHVRVLTASAMSKIDPERGRRATPSTSPTPPRIRFASPTRTPRSVAIMMRSPSIARR